MPKQSDSNSLDYPLRNLIDHTSTPGQAPIDSSDQRSEQDKVFRSSDSLVQSRKPLSTSTLLRFGLDLLLAIPTLCFLIYALLVLRNDSKPIDLNPVPHLQEAAQYGPTLFPIVFAAVAGNLLKAIAAWKLERGITILSLEYLLSSRTVFSTITTPFSLRAINIMTPLLFAFWALSPLGGQSAVRMVEIVPTTTSSLVTFGYLDSMSRTTFYYGDGIQVYAILGLFQEALSNPKGIKAASEDAYGNVKIPMIEAYAAGNLTTDEDGWYNVLPQFNSSYSSILGIPIQGAEGRNNFSTSIETSYMYTDCSLASGEYWGYDERWRYLNARNNSWNYGRDFVIEDENWKLYEEADSSMLLNRTQPQTLIFTYFGDNTTNATCTVTTTYVEADISCHWSDCRADRVRPSKKPHNDTAITVLDNYYASKYIFRRLVNVTSLGLSNGVSLSITATPLINYFTNPDNPYIGSVGSSVKGPDMYYIEDAIFSQRFSQLLNTFWIASIAPTAVMGNFSWYNNQEYDNYGLNMYTVRNVTGTMTPDVFELRCQRTWFAILVLASTVMLCASLTAAVLGLLRRGPDILDCVSMVLRDNPYARINPTNSMEDGFDQARRLKNKRLCLGDARSVDDKGYVAIGTLDVVKPMTRIKEDRLYE